MTARAPHRGPEHDHDTGRPLVPVEQVRRRMLSRIAVLPARELPLGEALGLVLAEDAAAPGDLPPFTSSAMDGFAVRAADVAPATSENPVALRLAGSVPMGRSPEVSVGSGQAVAVPTGGVIPDGADCVIPIERCVVEGDRVLVLRPGSSGRFVRPAGEDVREGDVLVPAGRRLLGPDLGLLASAGVGRVPVHPAARVVIVSTGDELVGAGAARDRGQVHDANAATLEGAVREAGALPISAGIVRDDPDALVDALRRHIAEADVIVSSGGVSVGHADPVKRAFAGHGDVEFVDVAMQPGKPQAFGTFAGVPFFGLPGNPVSVFVSFEVFVRPALLRMMGRAPDRRTISAILETDLQGPGNKAVYARVRVRREGDRWVAASVGGHRSNLLSTVSRANGLALMPVGVEGFGTGEPCRVLLFRDPGEP